MKKENEKKKKEMTDEEREEYVNKTIEKLQWFFLQDFTEIQMDELEQNINKRNTNPNT